MLPAIPASSKDGYSRPESAWRRLSRCHWRKTFRSRWGCNWGWFQRYPDIEDGPRLVSFRRSAGAKADPSTLLLHHGSHQPKPHTRALIPFGGKKHGEKLGAVCRVYAWSAIGDGDRIPGLSHRFRFFVIRPQRVPQLDANDNAAAGADGSHCVLDKVDEYLTQLTGIRL